MAISPHLLRKLKETLGSEAADDLVSWMEGMDAHRGDIGELRHEMQLGFARMDARFQTIDARFQTLEARFDSRLEKALREQTRFFFLAWSVLLAAIVGLYAR
jgi:hypothetical protein